MDKDYNPLVTIGVLTYNSSKYVLETLESAKAQTYKNIELIISDDCSTDNTVALCRKWVEENGSRFVRCEILTVEKNTGIPANCNRRLRASRGEWSKGIAGDDILAPDCIENFINFVKENPEAEWVCAETKRFKDTFKKENFINITKEGASPHNRKGITAEEQYRLLLHRGYCGGTPTFFFKKEALERVGGYDERLPLIEDYPMAMRLTKAGVKRWFMDKIVVFYRIHSSSVYNGNKQTRLFNNFYKVHFEFDRIYRFSHWSLPRRGLYLCDYYMLCLQDKLGLNRRNLFCKGVFGGLHPIRTLRTLYVKLREVISFLR